MKPTSGTPHAQLALGVHHLNAAVNLGLAAAKIAVGLAAGSPSLVAHGVENAADLLSNVLAWVGQRIALRPPDEDHHYGHGNAEALTAVGIGVIILVGGLGVAFGAATGRMAGGDAESPQGLALALAVAALSAIACEALARYDARAAAALSSPILKALARDKRSDALTSLIVMAGISGTYLGLDLAETVIAVGVGLWICAIGGRSISEGLDILMDRVPDIALREQLRASACAVAGVEAVDEVRIHPLGTVCRVEMEISVAGGLSVSEGHHIAHEVEDSITRSHGRIVQVAVHVNPA